MIENKFPQKPVTPGNGYKTRTPNEATFVADSKKAIT